LTKPHDDQSVPVVTASDAPAVLPVRVSVVICTRDRPVSLDRCLTGLTACGVAPFELIVVDNAPSRRPAKHIAAAFGARYMLEPQIGLSRARNAGARAATGDVVAFIDDDAAPDCQWLASVAAAFRDPDVGAMAGDIVPLSSTPDPTAYSIIERRTVRRSDRHWFEMASFGGIGNGANMAFRRDALLRVGGFDDRLGVGSSLPGCEEHEAFMRLIEADYSVVSDPTAVVFHDGGRDAHHRAAAQYAFALPYMLFLLIEKPAHRARVVRYALEAVFGKRRPWRHTPPRNLLTPWQRVAATLKVPGQTWRALVQSLGSAIPATPLN
jgi:GT2 family glycosyltransferase